MSEIYTEKLGALGDDYDSQCRALAEAANIAIDERRFTTEQIRTNLTELSEICDDEGLDSTLVDLLFEMRLDRED